MYRLLLASLVLVHVVDAASCTVPCLGFIKGDCRCHDAGPWAMWICTQKAGLPQVQPWFCSQPMCGCNGGGTAAVAPTGSNTTSPTPAGTVGTTAAVGAPATSPTTPATPTVAHAASPQAGTPQAAATFPVSSAPPLVAFAAPLAGTGPRAAAAATEITTEVTRKKTTRQILAAGEVAWPGLNGNVHLPATLRFACAPVRPPSDRFLVDACAEIDPGTLCEVRCNASAGWHGQATIFVCPPGNKNISQMAVPVHNASWPSCTQSKNNGSVTANGSGLHEQRAFLESSPLLRRRHVHTPIVVLLGVAVFAAMVSLVSLRRSLRLRPPESQHLFGTPLECQE